MPGMGERRRLVCGLASSIDPTLARHRQRRLVKTRRAKPRDFYIIPLSNQEFPS